MHLPADSFVITTLRILHNIAALFAERQDGRDCSSTGDYHQDQRFFGEC